MSQLETGCTSPFNTNLRAKYAAETVSCGVRFANVTFFHSSFELWRIVTVPCLKSTKEAYTFSFNASTWRNTGITFTLSVQLAKVLATCVSVALKVKCTVIISPVTCMHAKFRLFRVSLPLGHCVSSHWTSTSYLLMKAHNQVDLSNCCQFFLIPLQLKFWAKRYSV